MKPLFSFAIAIFLLSCNTDKKETVNTSTADSTKATITQKSADTPPAPADNAAMMKAWQAYMTPGDAQKRLAAAAGKWADSMVMYMPGAPPQAIKSSSENTMILNGMYQRAEHHGSFNGMPFEGISMMAYNNAAKKYQSSWIDNMGSGIMNMEGVYDSATNTYEMKGAETDPVTGRDIPVRETLKIIDPNHQYMQMFEIRDGKEARTLEVKSTRQ